MKTASHSRFPRRLAPAPAGSLLLALALALAVLPAAASGPAPGAMATKPGATSADLTPVPFDSATTARYRATAAALAKAVATDDAKAFRALHTDAGWAQADDWWQALLANQKRNFGRIVKAEGPLRGVVRGGSLGAGIPRDGAAILVRFEREAAATMSFVLDGDGRIVKSSLWVLRELAAAETGDAEMLWQAPKHGAKR